MDIPHIPRDLVRFLKEAFPDEIPTNLLSLSERAVGALYGQQQVVWFLEAHLRTQEESNVPT
jgi:hypothetical protein